jgi:hypothetical protein
LPKRPLKKFTWTTPFPNETPKANPWPTPGDLRQLLRNFIPFRRFDEFNGDLVLCRYYTTKSDLFGLQFPLDTPNFCDSQLRGEDNEVGDGALVLEVDREYRAVLALPAGEGKVVTARVAQRS